MGEGRGFEFDIEFVVVRVYGWGSVWSGGVEIWVCYIDILELLAVCIVDKISNVRRRWDGRWGKRRWDTT